MAQGRGAIAAFLPRRGSGGDGSAHDHGRDAGQDRFDHGPARAAPGARPATGGEGVGVERPGGDLGPDGTVVHRVAVADDHQLATVVRTTAGTPRARSASATAIGTGTWTGSRCLIPTTVAVAAAASIRT